MGSVELAELQRVWNRLGQTDPLWAVLTDARYKDGHWDPDELFAVGVSAVDRILLTAQERRLTFGRQAALDFGCGVGRLSQALAPHFDSVVGVDIAASMVAEAERLNKWGSKCRFVVNDRSDLSVLAGQSFDFIISLLVLQHIEPQYSRQYIREFLRVLRPSGLLVFQLPCGPPDELNPAIRELALPDDAYRAELSCPSAALVANAGSALTVPVTLRNPTTHTWPPSTDGIGLAVGNHWLAADGTELERDDGRAYLATELPGGHSTRLDLTVNPPSRPGDYVLELDMVHEAVTWFAGKGSATLRLPIRVRGAGRLQSRLRSRSRRAEAADGPTRMEMHTIPTADVTRLVEEGGARVSWTETRQVPGYTDCTYFVTRS